MDKMNLYKIPACELLLVLKITSPSPPLLFITMHFLLERGIVWTCFDEYKTIDKHQSQWLVTWGSNYLGSLQRRPNLKKSRVIWYAIRGIRNGLIDKYHPYACTPCTCLTRETPDIIWRFVTTYCCIMLINSGFVLC